MKGFSGGYKATTYLLLDIKAVQTSTQQAVSCTLRYPLFSQPIKLGRKVSILERNWADGVTNGAQCRCYYHVLRHCARIIYFSNLILLTTTTEHCSLTPIPKAGECAESKSAVLLVSAYSKITRSVQACATGTRLLPLGVFLRTTQNLFTGRILLRCTRQNGEKWELWQSNKIPANIDEIQMGDVQRTISNGR